MTKNKFLKKLNKLYRYRFLPHYFWYHKLLFNITNTKFDISFCVFVESFIQDQYRIRQFLKATRKADELFFLDLGRNHGFVFFYTMYFIMKYKFDVKTINYYGIDPSPLKFVYFNYFPFLKEKNIQINYYIIDKAVVREATEYVKLKYGEHNFGNFNIDISNYHKNLSARQSRWSFIELHVETISVDALHDLIRRQKPDSYILKIDCKFETSRIFLDMINLMTPTSTPYLISAEKDDSASSLEKYELHGMNILSYSNVLDKT